jgi:hypothetical protein
VCVFATHDILDEVRILEDRLQAENANYEVIFNHPGIDGHDLSPEALKEHGPVVVPGIFADAHLKVPEAVAVPHGDSDCSRSGRDGIYLVDGIEFKTCHEAYATAKRLAKAVTPDVKLEARPFDPFLNADGCSAASEDGVSWEFDGRKYSSCRAAVDAAVVKENEVRRAVGCVDQEFAPKDGCPFGVC